MQFPFFKYLFIYGNLLCLLAACSFKERPEEEHDNTATSSQMSIIRHDGSLEELKFQAPLEIDNIGTNPLAFVLKDLNEDDRLDVTLLNTAIVEEKQFLRILLRTAVDASENFSEWFQTTLEQPAGTENLRPQHLIVEDLDHDGIDDVLIAFPENYTMRLWKGQLEASVYTLATTFTEIEVGDFPTFLVAGEFETPGQFGVAVTNRISNDISLILDLSTDTKMILSEEQGVGNDPLQVVVGDWNNDGCPDLASLSSDKERVDFFKNTPCSDSESNTSFEKMGDHGVGENPQSLIVGDWDRDGQMDLAISNKNDDDLSLLYGKGDGTFERFDIRTGEGPGQLAFSDFNEDGIEDFVVGNLFDQDLSILLSNGDGKRPGENNQTAYGHGHIISGSIPAGNRPAFIRIADINHDEKPDIVLTLPYENKLSILLQQ